MYINKSAEHRHSAGTADRPSRPLKMIAIITQSEEFMNCPKCNNAELKKLSYNAPYLCSECGGMWLLNVESTNLQAETIEQIESDLDIVGYDKKTGLCPSGHGIMIRARVDIDEPFYLERCTACGGIWFDKGEWIRIAENNLADNLSNIWSKSWQRKQSKDNNRESFLKINQKLLGDQIFDSIMNLTKKLKDHPEKDRAIALLQQEIK